jgi:hypothetical protein
VPKKTAEEVKKEFEQVMREMAIFKENAHGKGGKVDCLSEEELLKKIRGESSKSPFLC